MVISADNIFEYLENTEECTNHKNSLVNLARPLDKISLLKNQLYFYIIGTNK